MKRKIIGIISFVSVLMVLPSCGVSSGKSESATTVTVERGPVFNATVKDSSGQIATSTLNSNKYTFNTTPAYPITVSGGQVDANYDGKIDSINDFALKVVLTAKKGLNITPMTTYLSDLNDSAEKTFLDKIGVNIKEVYSLPSEVSGVTVAAMNAAFSALSKAVLNPGANVEQDFLSSFDSLKSVAIVNNNATSVNITKNDLAEMEKIVSDELGLTPLTQQELTDITGAASSTNDNVTNNDNTTASN